jgi:ubiquinone/menaquinone biosynthesis C-methylase UbiE
MAQETLHFSDGAAYEQYMGRWSLVAGKVFLDWLDPPKSARWLDVGCGTGVFTELVLDTCDPATIVAVDPSEAQVGIAKDKPVAQRADFRVADAQSLPFPDGAFDVIASSLVINFIPDRQKALAEMRRVAHSGSIVAGYVWDFAEDRGPSSLLRIGLSQIGVKSPSSVGSESTRLEALKSLFTEAGLTDISTTVIDVTMSFTDFDEFWRTQTPVYTATGKIIAALSETERAKLIEVVRSRLSAAGDGSIAYSSRAHAVKARAP